MSNPYFSRSPVFSSKPASGERTPAGYPTMPGYEPGQRGAVTQTAPAPLHTQPAWGQQVGPDELAQMEQRYAAPSATNVDRGRMTYDDVIIRTAVLLGAVIAVGAVSWVLSTNTVTMGMGMMLMGAGALGSLVLGLVNSFKREPSPVLIVAYAVCEGAMLGAFSGVMEMAYPGIVMQAVLGTVVTFAVVLAAYKFGGFRVSGRAAKILIVAMIGYLLFSLVNFGLMVTGVVTDPWGLRGMTVAGIPLGVIIGLLAVVMAAFSLAMDFESIEVGVRNGAPRRYAWAGAFGLTVTLVWLYVEILRILAILRSND